MSRYQGSIHSGSSGSSRSSSSSSVSYRLDGGYREGAVTRHPNKNHRLPFRFAAHILRGPHAAEKPTQKKGHHHHSHRRGSSPSPPASVRRVPTGPRPTPVIYQNGQQAAYRQPQQPGPPPPPPNMMKPGGFGPGGQGFVQMNGNGRGVPPAQMPPMPTDPVWGKPQQYQHQYAAGRANLPYPRSSPSVVLLD